MFVSSQPADDRFIRREADFDRSTSPWIKRDRNSSELKAFSLHEGEPVDHLDTVMVAGIGDLGLSPSPFVGDHDASTYFEEGPWITVDLKRQGNNQGIGGRAKFVLVNKFWEVTLDPSELIEELLVQVDEKLWMPLDPIDKRIVATFNLSADLIR